MLHEYLKYAYSCWHHGGLLPVSSTDRVFESPFEEAVYNQLESLGGKVHTQLGVGRYRVDLAVEHPEKPGTYLMAVECDGDSYHRIPMVRDRDRLRQEVLEQHGWHVERIWCQEWLKNSAGVIARLEKVYEHRIRAAVIA